MASSLILRSNRNSIPNRINHSNFYHCTSLACHDNNPATVDDLNGSDLIKSFAMGPLNMRSSQFV